MTTYNTYISKYGNFSYILNLFINEDLDKDEKDQIATTIYSIIHDKQIEKNVLGVDIPIKWRVSGETDLLHYFTDGGKVLGDVAVQKHTKLLLNDIRAVIGKEKISFMVTKPLVKLQCLV